MVTIQSQWIRPCPCGKHFLSQRQPRSIYFCSIETPVAVQHGTIKKKTKLASCLSNVLHDNIAFLKTTVKSIKLALDCDNKVTPRDKQKGRITFALVTFKKEIRLMFWASFRDFLVHEGCSVYCRWVLWRIHISLSYNNIPLI